MAIQSIYELFVFDGEEFVAAAYRNLFDREPDDHGLAYYVGRLSLGYEKVSIISQMAKSPECRNCNDIKDLKKLISQEKRAWRWFRQLFSHYKQLCGSMQSNLNMLVRIRQNVNALQVAISAQSQQINALTDHVISLNQTDHLLNQRIVELSQRSSMVISPNETQSLPSEVVRQSFVEILGREPENQETIMHHARVPTRKALEEQLMRSEEFQNKLLALPEHALYIFKRQIKNKLNCRKPGSCV